MEASSKKRLKKTLAEAVPETLGGKFERLVKIVALLRTDCPWDRKQTHASLAHLLLEESYELLDALDRRDDKELKKELGDILLHLCFHALIASEGRRFDMNNVLDAICEKLVFRHPHVFGDAIAATEAEVQENWEKLKMREGRKSVLEGVPRAMPELLRALRVQHKAASLGLDWKEAGEVWKKVDEELDELRAAATDSEREAEFGDVLFTLVNLSRFINVNPEDAMRRSTEKFIARVQTVERLTEETGRPWQDVSSDELDAFWNKAKELTKVK
ncbi:MAG: nucleoside triphosphate pyrophosphohydrolase [Rhizobacter sp.]|nr:nucleoside triphosphate pyrophosphohydrolase [Chlorobiales bacterium]